MEIYHQSIVSVQSNMSVIKGILSNTKGKEDPQKMFCGSTLFIDHVLSLISIYDQVPLGTSDTIRSKELYELNA